MTTPDAPTTLIAILGAGLAMRAVRDMPELAYVLVMLAALGGFTMAALSSQ